MTAAGGPTSALVAVTESSQVGEARRVAATIAAGAGLAEGERGSFAVIVSEAATNLARHARDGMLLFRPVGEPGAGGVEMLSLDRGPGIRDLSRAMTDGFSTGGTPGQGLGAMRRMASEFDIYSSADTGTALVARLWSAGASKTRTTDRRHYGVVCRPIAGETDCGDAWAVIHRPQRTLVALADGLGHGRDAAIAAAEAIAVVRSMSDESPGEILRAAHAPLRRTRGAGLAVALISVTETIVRFAGVGNMVGAVVAPPLTKSLALLNGTVGHTAHRVQEFEYPWPPNACLVLHTDGLTSRWRFDRYPGLTAHDPSLVAGVLHRDFNRGRDDATALAVRDRATPVPQPS